MKKIRLTWISVQRTLTSNPERTRAREKEISFDLLSLEKEEADEQICVIKLDKEEEEERADLSQPEGLPAKKVVQ